MIAACGNSGTPGILSRRLSKKRRRAPGFIRIVASTMIKNADALEAILAKAK
jgi:hypothetical protein